MLNTDLSHITSHQRLEIKINVNSSKTAIIRTNFINVALIETQGITANESYINNHGNLKR